MLKKIFLAGNHEEMQLNGVGAYGNSKVIWVVNRLVYWGYVSITKIKTKEPNQLQIVVKKSADFKKICDDFEVVRAERIADRKAK